MPSTTVHIPDKILADIDRIATARGLSRNRFVIEACKEAIAGDQGNWSKDFFTLDLSDEDTHLLQTATLEMDQAIYQNRRNRGAPVL